MMNKLVVSPSPHLRDSVTTQRIMLDVILALLPALAVSVLVFGTRVLILELLCVACCVFFEWLFRALCHRSNTIGDLSAVVTGLLLAFNLPPRLPYWMAVVGCAAAILLTKQLFGGIGQNFANPAIVGRIVMLVSFGTSMTTWSRANSYLPFVDTVSGATPLALMKEGTAESLAKLPELPNFLFGVRTGCLGETCALALILGGIYLVVRRIITPTIPVVYIATVAILAAVFGLDPLYQVLSGGLLLGAIFMATDYTTSPATEKGKLIYAIGCGVITIVIRAFGSYPEGVSFSILLMNILTPHIDNLTRAVPFGGGASK